jgi:hypothetical protein
MGLAWIKTKVENISATQAPQIDRPNPRTGIDAQIHGELAAVPTAGARDLAAVPHIRSGEASCSASRTFIAGWCWLGV